MNLRPETGNSLLSPGFHLHLFSQHSNSNLVFSPLSIHVLLGMIAVGSKGPARSQILRFLFTSSSDHEPTAFFLETLGPTLADGSPLGGPVLSTANGLWADLSVNLKPAFRDLLHRVYGAVSERVDFQHKAGEVVDQVNKWGSKETNGLIKDILPSNAVDPRITKLILANAVYFKGAWSEKFDASLTKERDFYLLNGSSVRAPLMSSSSKDQYFRAFDGFKVLRLPYEHGGDGRRFSMYIYLPDAKDGLPALRERVCSESGFINAHLPFDKEKLDEYLIPKFRFAFDFEATHLLKRLGLVLVMTEVVEDSSVPLDVSKILHKSLVEVNEGGTEAAAVSVAVGLGSSGKAVRRERVEFVADHPFLFVIREDTKGIVLFIGQLLNPLLDRIDSIYS